MFESLSRPTSGEHTSSHDDSESMGSVRAGSAASGSVTGKFITAVSLLVIVIGPRGVQFRD